MDVLHSERIKFLIEVASALSTEEERVAWLESLTPEDRELFQKALKQALGAIREFWEEMTNIRRRYRK